MADLTSDLERSKLTLLDRIRSVAWGLVALILTVTCFGIAVLYSAADGNMQPWAATQMVRLAVAFIAMTGAALPESGYGFGRLIGHTRSRWRLLLPWICAGLSVWARGVGST